MEYRYFKVYCVLLRFIVYCDFSSAVFVCFDIYNYSVQDIVLLVLTICYLLFKLYAKNMTTQLTFTCSKSTIEIIEKGMKHRSGVFIVNFEHISQFLLVFLLLTLNT